MLRLANTTDSDSDPESEALARRTPLTAENQLPTAKPLADEVVRHALQHQLHARHGKSS